MSNTVLLHTVQLFSLFEQSFKNYWKRYFCTAVFVVWKTGWKLDNGCYLYSVLKTVLLESFCCTNQSAKFHVVLLFWARFAWLKLIMHFAQSGQGFCLRSGGRTGSQQKQYQSSPKRQLFFMQNSNEDSKVVTKTTEHFLSNISSVVLLNPFPFLDILQR